jgi:polyphosphate glucokinase
MSKILGIDVGATGIKGAIVDVKKGELLTDRIKYKTPRPATPGNMLEVMGQIIEDLDWMGKPLGVGFPAIIKEGVCYSASNIHKSWIGHNLLADIKHRFSEDAVLLNDADAAGVAELNYGTSIGTHSGVIIMLTLGTGIGSALFHNDVLLPNTEFGQLYYKDSIAEKYASNGAREKKELSWKEWGRELDGVIQHIDFIFSPDLIILGGGVSKKYKSYKAYLKLSHKIVAASLLNNAGIIGAAHAMASELKRKSSLLG